VKWVVNVTDVDDKLINRAKELNTTVPALAEADDARLLRMPEGTERHRHRRVSRERPSTSAG